MDAIDTSVNAVGAFIARREPGWHGLGEVRPGWTMPEILGYPGISFQVELQDIMTKMGKDIPGQYATVRTDTMAALGIVGDRYEVVQHTKEMGLFDEVFAEQGFQYETAGVLLGGKEVFLLAEAPEDFYAAAGDQLKRYVLANFSYDGSSSTRIKGVDLRVVCKNTQRIALRETGGLDWSIRHTASAHDKLAEVRAALASFRAQVEAHNIEIFQLVNATATPSVITAAMQAAVLEAFGQQPSGKDTKALDTYREKVTGFKGQVVQLIDTPNQRVGGIEGTSWSLYNAISEWADHVFAAGKRGSPRQRAENRFKSVIDGHANDIKTAVWNTLLRAA